MPDLSVVVLTWNSRRHIDPCVENTLADAERAGCSCEFFIVDNGSTDGTAERVRELAAEHPEIVPIFLESNRGTTVPRNLALRRATGELVCVLDSDAYPRPGCLATLREILHDPGTGIAVPRLEYPDGRYQKSVDAFPTLGRKLRRALFLRAMESRESQPSDGPVDYAISAFWMFRRDLLETVGLLDENIFYAPEDVDFCLRVWKAGYTIRYVPQAVAVHDAQEKSRRILPNRLTWRHLAGLAYYFRKHGYLFRSPRVGGSVRATLR